MDSYDAIEKIANVLDTYGSISISHAMRLCDIDDCHHYTFGFILDDSTDSINQAKLIHFVCTNFNIK